MKTFFTTLIILLCLGKSSQLCSQQSKQYFQEAVNQGIDEYLKRNNYQNENKYFIPVIKLIDCDQKRGEFSISSIDIDQEVPYTNPSYYYYYDDKIVLFRTDGLFSELLKNNSIAKVDSTISNKIFENLAEPYVLITGQPSPVMVVKYKKDKLEIKNYCGICPKEDKYSIFNDKR